ncbi:phage tail protein [Citrobacter portucalensis]|uniref:phage tail protein n=1 Tax=Citrobacter portucalensis TaxID=1639133 RepID=UPI00226BAEE7|nr:phage tail protein [Citrobacter portucalensis]MCX9038821.1 phage tail protein [Citrobacter portucalensis]
MKKPDSLRCALNNAIPCLRNNPDRLMLYVDSGLVISTGVPKRGWEYRYTLNIIITDFSGDQDLLVAVINDWLLVNQPDALNNPELREQLFRFEVDFERNDLCDIAFFLSLTERVLVSVDGGNALVSAIDEPQNPEERDDYWIRG